MTYINRIDSQDKEIERLENSIDTNKLNPKDKQNISEVKERLDYARYKGDRAKQDVTALKTEISKTGGSIQEISKLKFELEKLKDFTEKMITEAKLKIFTLGINIIGSGNQPDAAALWNISVDGPQYDNKYIEENGKIYNTVSELNNYKLEKILHNVDVIDTYIDSNGNFRAKVLDTYDFNPNEKDWKVQIARELQEKGGIQTYYTITEIVIPKNEWQSF